MQSNNIYKSKIQKRKNNQIYDNVYTIKIVSPNFKTYSIIGIDYHNKNKKL